MSNFHGFYVYMFYLLFTIKKLRNITYLEERFQLNLQNFLGSI